MKLVEIDDYNKGFEVTLLSCGQRKIGVIKEIRNLTGCSLKQTKDIVESTPSFIRKTLTHAEANAIKNRLEEIGAKIKIVEIREL